MIGIIGAMEIEISGLREQMEDRQTEHISGVRFDWGTIHGVLCAVAVCGPGKVNAAVCAQAMVMRFHAAVVAGSNMGMGARNSRLIYTILVVVVRVTRSSVTGLAYLIPL